MDWVTLVVRAVFSRGMFGSCQIQHFAQVKQLRQTLLEFTNFTRYSKLSNSAS